MFSPASRVRPQSCSDCALDRSFCHFPEHLRAAFDGLKTTVAYRKGAMIFDEGSDSHSVFAVCEGSVKLITASSEGRVLLLRVARPGEVLGLAEAVLGSAPYECSGIAAEASILAVIPRETFIRFISSYPEACVGLTVALSEQYKLAQRETKLLAFGASTFRLARVLLDWSAELGETVPGSGLRIPLHMTHTDLAQAIGSTRETVTRILTHLSHDGLIERRADGIVILRRDDLAGLGISATITANGDDAASEHDGDGVSIVSEPVALGGVS